MACLAMNGGVGIFGKPKAGFDEMLEIARAVAR